MAQQPGGQGNLYPQTMPSNLQTMLQQQSALAAAPGAWAPPQQQQQQPRPMGLAPSQQQLTAHMQLLALQQLQQAQAAARGPGMGVGAPAPAVLGAYAQGNLPPHLAMNWPGLGQALSTMGGPRGGPGVQPRGAGGLLGGPGGMRGGPGSGGLGGPLGSAGSLARPMGGLAGSSGSSAAVNQQVAAVLAQMRPGEAPPVEAPDGHEWVQCAGKAGKPEWFAVPRARAQALRLHTQAASSGGKRRTDFGPAGQPAAKAGGAARRKVDEDVTRGFDETDMFTPDDLQAELAVNQAAKEAVVVESGNVQEEYVLNQGPTMTLVARSAREGGVKAVADAVYAYLSLAAEAHLSQLLHSLVKMRLQREDLGRGYAGVEKVDDRGRAGLFTIQKREKEAARKREEEQRDELAKLGTTRKKLAEEDKKAAKAAQNARQLQQQRNALGSTLTKIGLGRRTFAFGSLGRPAAAAAGSKGGFSKSELLDVKAAAAAADGEAPGGGTGSGEAAAGAGAGVKAAAAAPAAAAAGGPATPHGAGAADPSGATAASDVSSRAQPGGGGGSAGPPLLKPMSLQHQLLSPAQAEGGGVPAFVAGGASASRAREGETELRELTLADLIAVLERHPLHCRSPQLYALHALAGQPPGGGK